MQIHVTDPITVFEKMIIRYIFWRYRDRGDVVACLAEKSDGHG